MTKDELFKADGASGSGNGGGSGSDSSGGDSYDDWLNGLPF